MNAEQLDELIEALEAKEPNGIAFDAVTWGQLLEVAKAAAGNIGAADGVDSANTTMAAFEDKHG